VLRPGGQLWIIEHCTAPLVYGAQVALAPAVRGLLERLGSPHILMHSERFLAGCLALAGFTVHPAFRAEPRDARWTDTVAPLLAAPSFRIPMLLYPINQLLLGATR
jgi:hypothetical protein